ncbi:hypothetical protein P5G51_009200 [Virgibacillus sp. 179-BFC.A HS]|uniref:Uncharacterized protein n=1 Tax=Tigheibacillus jepli TaxID=3035914 RepID=A0ABU5CHW5_9BACI|nr:hypothetical protein [Virgibacillus sp. 179-BFC.A HS]MDY0405551.1 hypothetical protein [Virgibacillus sp. 179-BFC.A HS]
MLKNKTDIFYKKWKHNYLHHQRILDQMMRANVKNEQKIAQYSQEMQWIKEVLSDEAAADQRRHF